MKTKNFNSGYLLAEQMVAIAIAVLVGGSAMFLFQGGLRLYTKVAQSYVSEEITRRAMQEISLKVYEATERPQCINVAGGKYPNSSGKAYSILPTEGILFKTFRGAARQVVTTSSSTSRTLLVESSTPEIQVGDWVLMASPVFNAQVTTLIKSETGVVLGFASPLGRLSTPRVTTERSDFITAGSALNVYRFNSIIAVPKGANSDLLDICFYSPAGFSGATVLAANLPLNGNSQPFTFDDSGWSGDPPGVHVRLTARANEYSHLGNSPFYSSLFIDTVVSWRNGAKINYAEAKAQPAAPVTPASPSPANPPTTPPKPTNPPTATPANGGHDTTVIPPKQNPPKDDQKGGGEDKGSNDSNPPVIIRD